MSCWSGAKGDPEAFVGKKCDTNSMICLSQVVLAQNAPQYEPANSQLSEFVGLFRSALR